MEMTASISGTSWEVGRFDGRNAPQKLLFGQTHEDGAIELKAFGEAKRIFCIAGGGDTAFRLASRFDVTAVDINPSQIAYVERRLAGGPRQTGTAERIMGFLRTLAPLAGWRESHLRAFLALFDPADQVEFWQRHLNTRRFRAAFDLALSLPALRSVYAPSFLSFLPARLGTILRGRLERGWATHPNQTNPYARALLLGEPPAFAPQSNRRPLRLVCADAATFLESQPPQCYNGFALSNILDGASPDYARRLAAAIKRSAAPGALTVLRSIREPVREILANHAAADRSMIWGIVDIQPAADLNWAWLGSRTARGKSKRCELAGSFPDHRHTSRIRECLRVNTEIYPLTNTAAP